MYHRNDWCNFIFGLYQVRLFFYSKRTHGLKHIFSIVEKSVRGAVENKIIFLNNYKDPGDLAHHAYVIRMSENFYLQPITKYSAFLLYNWTIEFTKDPHSHLESFKMFNRKQYRQWDITHNYVDGQLKKSKENI